jgi:hypothetical protein
LLVCATIATTSTFAATTAAEKILFKATETYFVPFVVDVIVGLLRARGERPNRCRTNTHKVAPPHVT